MKALRIVLMKKSHATSLLEEPENEPLKMIKR